MNESKEAIIKRVYAVTGYGSVRDTYVQANKINPGVRYVDVKEYSDKLQHRQTQVTYIGEVDLIHLTGKAEENMLGLVL